MDFTKLWDKRYLLGPNPLDLSRSDLIFLWMAIGFLVLSVAAKVTVLKQDKDSPRRFLASRLFHLLATMGILMLVWAGSRFENIPWLSTHVVVLSLLLIALVWFGFIAKYFLGDFKRQLKLWREEVLKRKYLPH